MTEGELKKHLDAAEKSPKQIAAAVSGLPDEVLRYKPSPEKWCILEILGHLVDIEIVYAYRMRQMLAGRHHIHHTTFQFESAVCELADGCIIPLPQDRAQSSGAQPESSD